MQLGRGLAKAGWLVSLPGSRSSSNSSSSRRRSSSSNRGVVEVVGVVAFSSS